MGRPRKIPPHLVREGTQFYIVDGKTKIDVGRSERVAQRQLAEYVKK